MAGFRAGGGSGFRGELPKISVRGGLQFWAEDPGPFVAIDPGEGLARFPQAPGEVESAAEAGGGGKSVGPGEAEP